MQRRIRYDKRMEIPIQSIPHFWFIKSMGSGTCCISPRYSFIMKLPASSPPSTFIQSSRNLMPCSGCLKNISDTISPIPQCSGSDDVPEVSVFNLGHSLHTVVCGLQRVGRSMLLVSDLVVSPHLNVSSSYHIGAEGYSRRTTGDSDRWF